MNSSNSISPLTGMVIMLVTILVMMVVRKWISSSLLRSLVAVGIAGGLVLLLLVAKRIRSARNTPPVSPKP